MASEPVPSLLTSVYFNRRSTKDQWELQRCKYHNGGHDASSQEEHTQLHRLRSEEAVAGVNRKAMTPLTYGYPAGHVGPNGGTGLVGATQSVAVRFHEFRDIGVTTFHLQFHPMLEKMERFGEHIIPRLSV